MGDPREHLNIVFIGHVGESPLCRCHFVLPFRLYSVTFSLVPFLPYALAAAMCVFIRSLRVLSFFNL